MQKAKIKYGDVLAAKIRALPKEIAVGDYFSGSGAFSLVSHAAINAISAMFPDEAEELEADWQTHLVQL